MLDVEKGKDSGFLIDAPRRKRFTEAPHFAPIAFVVFTILILWAIYNFFHCARLLQLGLWHRPEPVDEHDRWLGWIELVVFNFFFTYARRLLCSMYTGPPRDNSRK